MCVGCTPRATHVGIFADTFDAKYLFHGAEDIAFDECASEDELHSILQRMTPEKFVQRLLQV
jgi:hypothetical protein